AGGGRVRDQECRAGRRGRPRRRCRRSRLGAGRPPGAEPRSRRQGGARSRRCGARRYPRAGRRGSRRPQRGRVMLDHVVLWVTDMARSTAFYDRTLQPLGITRITGDDHAFAGYGTPGKRWFWIGPRAAVETPAHVAFAAADRATVEAFHAA